MFLLQSEQAVIVVVVALTNQQLFCAHISIFLNDRSAPNGYIFNEIGHELHIQCKSVPKIQIS